MTKIHGQLKKSNKIAKKRLKEQQRATDAMSISQAHATCQDKGDQSGADEMHTMMLKIARAAGRRHNLALDSTSESSSGESSEED